MATIVKKKCVLCNENEMIPVWTTKGEMTTFVWCPYCDNQDNKDVPPDRGQYFPK